MEYNTQRSKIIISEYGRNIQKMIDHAITITDRTERNLVAQTIVKVMGQVNSQYKDSEDFIEKLWDHLFIMSDYKLDVDPPFHIPEKEKIQEKPKKVEYPDKNIKYRHYGHAIQRFITKASKMEEGEEKDSFTYYIANMMKKNFLLYNRETVDDELIHKHLEELSNGELKIRDEYQLKSSGSLVGKKPNPIIKKKKKKKINFRPKQ
ncbi:MAG: hypothetical protein RLZZ414_1224 [Bacteroidota bacterium]|jgi:hypothetical protein